jgi:hypothetical protein
MLHDAVVLLRRGHDLLRFKHVVRAGLLDIDVFAGLTAPDCLECVVMVGGGYRNRVDGFVFQQLPQIGESGWPLLTQLLYVVDALIEDRLVDIANRRDFDVVHPGVMTNMRTALAAHAHASNAHGIVGAGKAAGTYGCGRRRTHQKMSSIHEGSRLCMLPQVEQSVPGLPFGLDFLSMQRLFSKD